VPDPEELVQVYATGSLSDGLLIKGRLEAEGIPVLLKGEGEGPYRVGPVYLWVPNGLEVQARLVLESLG
jgi:Putative prokaryotic signal transducing protein